LNRRVGRLTLFDKPADYMAFEKILNEAHERTGIRIAAYCLMPNHWHLVLWPRDDGELSEVMRWITVTHTQRWHAHRQSFGSGPVYQGRFRSFPVQTDEHFLTVARYVERNALRAKLVKRAEQWQWSSLWRWAQGDPKLLAFLSDWPVKRPRHWVGWTRVDLPLLEGRNPTLGHCWPARCQPGSRSISRPGESPARPFLQALPISRLRSMIRLAEQRRKY